MKRALDESALVVLATTVDGELKRVLDESTLEGLAAVDVANAPDLTFVEEVAASILMVGGEALAKLLTMTVPTEVMLGGVIVCVSARIAATCGPME